MTDTTSTSPISTDENESLPQTIEPDDTMTDATETGATPVDASEADQEADEQDPVAAEPEWTPSPLFAGGIATPRTLEVSPDGEWVAYLLERDDRPAELWISPADGGEPQQVDLPFTPIVERDPDTGRLLRGPQWSPNGHLISLAGTVEGEQRTAIWLVPSPVDSDATPLVVSSVPDATSEDATEGETVPEVEPDAEATEASSETAETADADALAEATPQVSAVVEHDAALREPRLLTWGPGSERSPRWSLDGSMIAFVTNRGGRDAIALATTDGEEPTIAELLTWSDRNDREPVWSRDGRFLAFTRQRSDGIDHADILVWAPETGVLTDLTSAKSSAVRHSLEWVPGRNLIAYVTIENDWLSISVINADNKAGWAVTRESGDKTEPRFHPTEARLLYVRSEGFTTVCCERGLHASGAVALDPGEGVVTTPRWLKDKRVVYGFAAPQKPLGFLAQENVATADRETVQLPEAVDTSDARLRHPTPFEFTVGDDGQFSGLLYRTEGTVGSAPALVYIPDGPLQTRRGEFQIEEQALASSGIAVLAPVIHGATGFGLGVEQDLADLVQGELEVSDLAEAGYALGEAANIDASKLALVGVGYGGALALLTAGARPGIYSAVVAIDPVADWSIEAGEADTAWRNWISRTYGMPLTNADTFTLRTPSTFAGVIDVPIILIGRANAPVHRQAQLEILAATLDEYGVSYQRIDAGEEPVAATLQRAGRALAGIYRAGHDTIEVVEDIRADALG